MSKNVAQVEFLNRYGEKITEMKVFAEDPSQLREISVDESEEFVEAKVQIFEGKNYEYKLGNPDLSLNEIGSLISKSKITKGAGIINPGLNVGTLMLSAQDEDENEVARGELEVVSHKLTYRDDYRRMLEDITDNCASLLFELRSPAHMRVIPDPGKYPETIAQRFAFVKSLLTSRKFTDAVRRIINYYHRRWEPIEQFIETRKGFKGSSKALKSIASDSCRVQLSDHHPLKTRFGSLPRYISVYRNVESIDTQENRFVKYALRTFLNFLNKISNKLNELDRAYDKRLQTEVRGLEKKLESVLRRDFFRGISDLHFLPLGSPVLQRKEGYREVLEAWLRFDMAARLVWEGGDDVYHAGKRDIAQLYEYWVFFKLLKCLVEIFEFEEPIHDTLFEKTYDGFGLKLKSGEHLFLDGKYQRGGRKLRIKFSYNKTFKRVGSVKNDSNYPNSGAWTEAMRPDYSITFWPNKFSEEEAEKQELIVHILFDAKYRIDNLKAIFGFSDFENTETEEDPNLSDKLSKEKNDERTGKYKRADLLKMHAYKDAIRRTEGAYIIYPGERNKIWRGYHEIIPGMGAFALRPNENTACGTKELYNFINDVAVHLCDRTTEREHLNYHKYDVHDSQKPYKFNITIPEVEPGNTIRHKPPVETVILVGWCKGDEHLKWIRNNCLYNFRIGGSRGSLRLSKKIVLSDYLLLHQEGLKAIDGLFRIVSDGPRIFSGDDLIEKGYPGKPSSNQYMVFAVENAVEFKDYSWEFGKIESRPKRRLSAWPFTITLDELMSVVRVSH